MKKPSVIIQAGKFTMYFISILFSLCAEVWSQGNENLRKVSINKEDTMVLASILTGTKTYKVHNDIFYYWYSSGKIYQNQGGYSGNLLHGEYIELDKPGNMIVKGNFHFGIKDGVWNYWHSDGSIKEITRWKNGCKTGYSVKYSPSGEIIFKGNYRKGRKNGMVFFIENDESFKAYYHGGKEIYRKPLNKKATGSENES